MRKLVTIIGLLASLAAGAQKVTGYWYGQANVEMAGTIHNNYLTELIIAQKGNKVKGFFGYYFKDVYQSFLVKGSYDPQTRKIVIRNIPIIYFNTNSTVNSVDCITSFYGTLLVSKVKTSLSGYFYRDKKYEYTCPDLRVNYTLFSDAVNEDSLFNEVASIKRFWKPLPENYGIEEDEKKNEDNKTAQAKTEDKKPLQPSNQDAKVSPTAKTHGNDSLMESVHSAGYAAVKSPIVLAPPPDVRKDIVKISTEFRKRKQVLDKEVEVLSDSVRLSFYDNAEIDGDSISVFLNNNLILAHQELKAQALNIYVTLDSTKEINEVSMFAENLGKYPPNTALMVVNDGIKRYEIFLSSDFKGNATVRFKRRKPE